MSDALITILIVLELLVLLGIWVALPLVPAILIYRYFPDTQVAASGPLAGLTVKASGAFAAYLVVFLLIFALVSPIKDVIGSGMRPFWEIRGKVKLVDENGKPISGEGSRALNRNRSRGCCVTSTASPAPRRPAACLAAELRFKISPATCLARMAPPKHRLSI
jgi:hypothetical protein